MNRMNILIRGLLFGFMCVMVMASCVREEDNDSSLTEGMTKVIFRMRKPNTISVSARTLATVDEDRVEEVSVLVFGEDGKYISTYQVDTDISQSDKTVTFEALLNNGTFDLLVVANANTEVEAANLTTSDTRESAAKKITIKTPANGMWNTVAGSQEYRSIPMCGESGITTLNGGAAVTIELSLVRMLAKVEISLVGNAQKNFKVTNIYMANYNRKGQIAVNANSWNSDKSGVTITSTPNYPDKTEGSNHMLNYSDKIVDNKSCTNEIYLMEANHINGYSGTSVEWRKNPCIIIGGKYKNESNVTYYRLDYVKKNNATYDWLSVLRNYKYSFNISDVTGSGYDSHGTAYNSAPVNMKYNVVDIDESLPYSEQDGPYMLAVSHAAIDLPPDSEGAANINIKVMTNFHAGWRAELYQDAAGKTALGNNSWLELPQKGGGPNFAAGGEFIKFRNPKGGNDTSAPREAYLHITSGRMKKVIKVVQHKLEPASNSYIAPGGATMYIPLKQLYYAKNGYGSGSNGSGLVGADFTTDTDLPIFKASVFWSDVNDFNTANSPVREVSLSPVPAGATIDSYLSTGCITVKTGASEGNAIILLWTDKNKNGKLDGTDVIKWTWHIWRLNKAIQITGGKWMDRNLGALKSKPAADLTGLLGFYYQWGRKDPFIHPKSSGDNYSDSNFRNRTMFFNGDLSVGDDFKGGYKDGVRVTLGFAVRYPLNFYFRYEGWLLKDNPPGLWGAKGATTEMQHLDHLNGYKSVYDPCPVGYSVPEYEDYSGGAKTYTLTNNYALSGTNGGCFVFGGALGSAGEYADWPTGGYYLTRELKDKYKASVKYFTHNQQSMGYTGVGQAAQIRCVKIIP